MKKNINKKIILSIVAFMAVFALIGIVSAAQCNDGVDNDLDGKIDYPADNGCDSSTDNLESLKIGYAHGCFVRGDELGTVFGETTFECEPATCTACVLMTETGNWTTDSSRCNGLTICGFNNGGGFGGNTTIDQEPPILDIFSPSNDELFRSRKALIDLSTDEPANIYYTDVINGRGRWSKICSDCTVYERNLSFDEGQNTIQFKAIDSLGNTAYSDNISFFIDSKKPKIKKTLPKKGFANGDFWVEFQEENPEALTLFYGNSSQDVDLETCIPSGTRNDKQSCTVNVDLAPYDGQEIQYWYEITDIAGNTGMSKLISIDVDMTPPLILNPDNFFHYENGTKYVYFHMGIEETNFDEIIYSYIDYRGRLKEKRICSRLDDEGMCEKRLSFARGTYNLTVSAWDDAGNTAALPANFVVDY